MTNLFQHAADLSRAHAADLGIPLVVYEGGADAAFQRIAIGHWTYAFYPNECSRYHAAIRFKGERCPACKALAERERLEDKLDDLQDRLDDSSQEVYETNKRLSEISRRRI